MDARNQFLALALYVTLGVAAVLAAFFSISFYHYSTAKLDTQVLADQAAGMTERMKQGKAARDLRLSDSDDNPTSATDDQRIAALETLLEKKDRLLSEQQGKLKEQAESQLAMKKDLENYMALIVDLLAPSGAGTDPDMPPELLQTELDRTRSELSRTTFVEAELGAELERLRAELASKNEQLATAQADAAIDIAELLAEQQAVRNVAAATVARTGQASVTPLIELLADTRPNVRLWAINSLGRVGPQASDAIPTLLLLNSNDPEEGVRQAAREALSAIDPGAAR